MSLTTISAATGEPGRVRSASAMRNEMSPVPPAMSRYRTGSLASARAEVCVARGSSRRAHAVLRGSATRASSPELATGPSIDTKWSFHSLCSVPLIRSFMISYLSATLWKTSPTMAFLASSGTSRKPKCVVGPAPAVVEAARRATPERTACRIPTAALLMITPHPGLARGAGKATQSGGSARTPLGHRTRASWRCDGGISVLVILVIECRRGRRCPHGAPRGCSVRNRPVEFQACRGPPPAPWQPAQKSRPRKNDTRGMAPAGIRFPGSRSTARPRWTI